MPTLIVPDATGHTTIDFDKTDPESLARAQAKFEECLAEKQIAFHPILGRPGEHVKDYSGKLDLEQDTTMRRQLVGG